MQDATHNQKILPRMAGTARIPAASTSLKEIVLHGNLVAGDPSIGLLARGASGNDAFYAEPANAATVTADAPVAPAGARMTGYELLLATRYERAALIGSLIVMAVQAVRIFSRRAWTRLALRRRAWATYDALNRLDDHTLRDIGLDRSELAPLAGTLRREAVYAQMRGALAPNSLPR